MKIAYLLSALIVLLLTGCNLLPFQKNPPPEIPLKVLVTQMRMEAPLSSPSDLHSFKEPIPREDRPIVLAQLTEELETRAQRLFTEQLAQQEGFIVIPFDNAYQIRTETNSPSQWLNKEQRITMGSQAGADIVISGRILDFGKVQWQYWVTGLLLSMTVETLIVGAATGFNPGIMAIAAASELVTDLPFWWGGAYIAGWAFRPVRINMKAVQISGCEQVIWKEEELMVRIPGKSLKKHSPEEQKRKEVQLGVNLEETLKELAKIAGRELRLKPCKKA